MQRASFLPDDPPSLVEASLACPLCLHACDWRVAGLGGEATVDCRCRGCGHERTVELSGPQLLRLTVPDDEDEADAHFLARDVEGRWQRTLWD